MWDNAVESPKQAKKKKEMDGREVPKWKNQ